MDACERQINSAIESADPALVESLLEDKIALAKFLSLFTEGEEELDMHHVGVLGALLSENPQVHLNFGL